MQDSKDIYSTTTTKIWKIVDVDVSKILIFWPLNISKFTSLTPILHSIFHNLCNI